MVMLLRKETESITICNDVEAEETAIEIGFLLLHV